MTLSNELLQAVQALLRTGESYNLARCIVHDYGWWLIALWDNQGQRCYELRPIKEVGKANPRPRHVVYMDEIVSYDRTGHIYNP
jgi:hypothetical protein